MTREKQSIYGVLAALGLGLAGVLWFADGRRRTAAPVAPEVTTLAQSGITSGDGPNSTSSQGLTRGAARGAVDYLQQLRDKLPGIGAEKNPLTRDSKIDEWVKEVPLNEIPALVEFLDHQSESPQNREVQFRLMRKMAEEDPKSAAEFVVARPAGPDRQRVLKAVATTWAGRNLEDAISWARQLPEDDRYGVLTSVAYEAVGSDPRKALELASELPADDGRTELISHIAGEWTSKNPEQIAKWAGQLQDEELRQQVISRVAASWGETNPYAAADLALNSLPSGRPLDDAVMGIMQRWVQTAPAEAAAWITQFPEGELRENATEELVKLWADKNFTDAGNWLSALPVGAGRDAASNAYIGKILDAHPEFAAQWASQISSEAMRNAAMERVATAWMNADPTKASAWIGQSSLPDELKRNLTTPRPQ